MWHLAQDHCWNSWISAYLGIDVEKIWVDSGYGDKRLCTQSHWGKELGKLHNPDEHDPFASVFWGTSPRGGVPSRGELVPKAGARAKLLSYSCTGSAAGSVRSWRMAEWLCFGTGEQGSPCCIEGNVSNCTLKYLWFHLNFFPKHIHYFLTAFAGYRSATEYRLQWDASDSGTHYTAFCSRITSLSPPLLCGWHFKLPCSRELGPEVNPNSMSVLRGWHLVQLTCKGYIYPSVTSSILT